LYQVALGDQEVYKHFSEVISKARKFQKAEAKGFIDDFEKKVQEIHEKGASDLETTEKAAFAATKTGAKRGEPFSACCPFCDSS